MTASTSTRGLVNPVPVLDGKRGLQVADAFLSVAAVAADPRVVT